MAYAFREAYATDLGCVTLVLRAITRPANTKGDRPQIGRQPSLQAMNVTFPREGASTRVLAGGGHPGGSVAP